ncbi:MAG TPA: TRAP transporter large permease [Deltaproteobacteria bacterium]|nr:TRAP transporter large permease [Deltaproteobacteria bacterium]HOM29671.1 TRAP transporter large permease [Deltaproteobacteria bacterium]HPP81123.1 TRAP transporter large permease [Deltaproteobacteria bacterium]
MTPTQTGIVGLVALVVLLFSRMPVAFIMALVGFWGFASIVSTDAALNLLAKDVFSTFTSYSLTVIPLFVLMGQVAFHSGISRRLFDTAHKFMGHLPGGLAIATIGACAFFASICGSTNATAATMGSATLPEMKRYDYHPELATGVVASAGSLGILIPPSVIFIVYGILTEQSIGKLFISGILPGVILALLFVLTVLVWVKLRPELGPRGPRFPLRERMASLAGVSETLVIFVLVMGGLFAGVFTPTEAGAMGAFFTIVVAVARGQLSWKGFLQALSETTRITCMIMVIVAGATVFGHFLAVSRIPYDIAGWISGFDLPAWVIMGLIILGYVVGGCFMDALALIMLTIPIFYPVVLKLGFDPIWFGVIIVLVTQIGVVTPPVGVNAYVVSGVARDVPLQVIFKGCIPFIAAMVILTFLLIPFPQIATFLPGLIR